jgi:hypothetical protein
MKATVDGGRMHMQTAPLRFNPPINARTLLLAPSNVTDPSDGGDVVRSFLITVLHSLRAVRLCVRFGVGLTGCMRSDWLPDRGVRAVAMKAAVDGGRMHMQTAPLRFNPPTTHSDRHVLGSLYCGHSNENHSPRPINRSLAIDPSASVIPQRMCHFLPLIVYLSGPQFSSLGFDSHYLRSSVR